MMMVATPRATMANQLKKGTVQLNVLQREDKCDKRIRRHGKYEQKGVSMSVTLLFDIIQFTK